MSTTTKASAHYVLIHFLELGLYIVQVHEHSVQVHEHS